MDARLYMVNATKDPGEAKRIAVETAQKIEKRELKLLEVVQSLGEHLTDDDTTIRAKAIRYLAAVLEELGPKSLTRQQVPVVTQFLCDRLEDETGLKETALGLTALTKMQHFGNAEATQVATALTKIDLPKHPHTTRFTVITLLDALMLRHRDALKAVGGPLVGGLVDVIGGEKDPRNLMAMFSVMKVILVEFDIVDHVDVLFDMTFAYFPIAWRPPADDPYGITVQDLKQRLRECIAATHYFAGHAFPLLIDKLDSTSPSVKLDVLQTMAACTLSYGPRTVSTHSTQIWDAVKYEVLKSTGDDEIVDEALQAIRAIAVSLSFGLRAPPPPSTPLARYLKDIVKEGLELLKEPAQKQAKPAAHILATVATASSPAHALIIESTVPALLLIYGEADVISKRRALLEVFNLLIESTVTVYGDWTTTSEPPIVPNTLQKHQEKLFEIYSQALMGSNRDENSFRLAAMRGLGLMSKIRKFLEEGEMGMIVQYLDEVALGLEENENMRNEALRNLREISKFRSSHIMHITFPAFMAQLPDSDAEPDARKKYGSTLEALAKLSIERPVFEVLLTRLLNKLDVVLQAGCGPEYPKAILSTLLYVLQQKPQLSVEDTRAYFARLVPPLLTKTIISLVQDHIEPQSQVLADDIILDVTGRLVNNIVKSLDLEQQTYIINEVFNLFLLRKPSNLILEDAGIVSERFCPFETSDSRQAGAIVVLACVLAAVRREIVLPCESLLAFLEQNMKRARAPKSPAHRLAHLRVIALLTNKWISKDGDLKALKDRASSLVGGVSASVNPNPATDEDLRILFWITKALILKADKYAFEATEKLVNLLGSEHYGSMTSRGFSVLLGDDEFLNKENYAVVRLLSKQRVFSLCVPKLVDGFKTAQPGVKRNYLVALSNILRNVPSSVVAPELPRLVPLLLQSIDLPDVDIKAATIETLHVTLRDSADALKEHVSSVITRLLTACSPVENPPRVRIAALGCLRSFPGSLRGELLLPFKRQVMQRLLPVLDDPKRTVRKEAVDCKAKWFAMDEPES